MAESAKAETDAVGAPRVASPRGDPGGFSDAVLGTLYDAQRADLAAWLRAQGVEPHRRGMAPRNWVPVTLPKRTWRLARPLAPGVKPAYLMPPTPGVSQPGDPPGEAYPITEAQAAYAYRLRRERADRAARGEPEPETRHDRHHRRLEEETAARGGRPRAGGRPARLAGGPGPLPDRAGPAADMPRPNVARLEAGGLFPGIPVLQRLAQVAGGALRVDVRPDGVTVRFGAPGRPLSGGAVLRLLGTGRGRAGDGPGTVRAGRASGTARLAAGFAQAAASPPGARGAPGGC